MVLIDDSIVRGTTSGRIVELLREAGAKEIHMRISSPPFLHPCYYGTDIDSREHLIACRHTVNVIAEIIGADTLGYLPVEEKASEMDHFTDWDKVIPIDHGYDESKPEEALTLEDMKGAAKFRGGECLSDEMTQGDWQSKLAFRCAFGHTFKASPRLVLEGGHWCPECERKSWNYGARAKVDPFFAQVWNPLHDPDEMREYLKEVTELDV